MAQNETARTTVYLDGKQAEAALGALADKAKSLNKDLKEALDAGDNVKFNKLRAELGRVESAQRSVTKESFDVQNVLMNINKVSWRDLEKAQKAVIAQMKGMTRGTEEYTAKQGELQLIRAELNGISGAASKQIGIIGKLKDTASELLPAFSFAAIASAAVFAFNKIISATDTLGTKWEASMNGMNEGLNEFWRTLATGDWSNFTDRIREAIKLGEEYVYTLDDIEDKTRSMSIIEAEAREKELDLEIKLRNKTLSKEERIKAGEERIQLEKDLSLKRTTLAQETFDNEANLSAMQTKLSKDQLMSVMRDFDSSTKIKAKAYNDEVDKLAKMKAANVTSYTTGQGFTSTVSLPDSEEMKQSKTMIDSVSGAVKLYADQIRATGRTTDDQLDKMVGSYVNFLGAKNSAVENIKKTINTVNSLIAGQEDTGQKMEGKNEKKVRKTAADELKAAYEDRLLIIKAAYLKEGWTKEEYEARIELAGIAHLEAQKQLLILQKEDTTSIELEIADARIKIQTDAYKIIEDLAITQKDKVLESIDEMIQSVDDSIAELEKIKNKEDQLNESRGQTYSDLAINVGESLGDLLTGQEKDFGQFLRNTLVMALDALEKTLLIKKTEAIISAIASGPLAILTAVGKLVAMTAAFGIAKSVILGGNKGKQSGGYADSDSSDSTPVGVYHANEFIASGPAVRNPTIKPILDIIDLAQRSGTIRSLNLPAMIGNQGRQSGGYASPSPSSSGSPVTMISGRDPELTSAIIELNSHLRKGIKANINKFGTGSLDEGMNDITKFNSKIGKKS